MLLADVADGGLGRRAIHEQPVVVGIVGQLRASRVPADVVAHLRVAAAQDDLARAHDNRIDALYRYNQARADLARATGQMEAGYTK